MLSLPRFFRDRRGVAAVEFAFVAPVLILIYMGLAEVTMALMAERRGSVGCECPCMDDRRVASGYKADARSYNVAQEDIDSFLKYGKVKHGEWFLECQRLPGGDHSKPLPDEFSERPEQPADFPEYERKLSVTDGCAGQFDDAHTHC